MDKDLQLKQDKEKYLASLNEDREHYIEQLDNLDMVWNQLKLYFSNTSDEFLNIIKTGNIPADAVKTTFTFHGIEGLIDEKTFNDIVSKNPNLSDMVFRFHSNGVEISIPDKELVLTGTFDIRDGNIIRFVADGGSIYGIALEPETISELFKDGSMALDLKPLVGKSTLDSVEVSEGYLKFVINPIF
jgi:hypothetical protein